MAKKSFLEINVKAAAITGAIIGFLASLFAVAWYGMVGTGYGIMGYMMGYAPSLLVAPLIVVEAVICGAITGALIALLYNWLLKVG